MYKVVVDPHALRCRYSTITCGPPKFRHKLGAAQRVEKCSTNPNPINSLQFNLSCAVINEKLQ